MKVITPLWTHQEQAIKRVKQLINTTTKIGGAGLFMGVRSGKTLTSLKIVEEYNYKLILVVTKKRAINVWKNEILEKTDGKAHIITLNGNKSILNKSRELKEVLSCLDDRTKFIIANYEIVWREPLALTLEKAGIDLVIADEAQKIKTATSKVSKFMGKLGSKVRGRLALTATPYHNSLLDIYGIARFVNKSVFNMSWTAFKQRYALWGGFNNYVRLKYINEDELREKTDGFSFYVSRDGLFDLPPVTHNVIKIELKKETYETLRSFEQNYIASINNQGATVIANNVLTQMLRLQQMVNGTVVIGEKPNQTKELIDTSKIEILSDLLDEYPLDEPLVIFYKFKDDLELIRNEVVKRGFTYGELNGSVDNLEDWQAGKSTILLVQLESGGAGIELARSNVAIFYSLSWSLGDHTQALGRLHGPNQTRPVTFHYLVGEKTIDEDVIAALQDKQEPIDRIIKKLVNKYEREISGI